MSGLTLPWLGQHLAFPPVETALRQPNGLVAVGGDLSEERMLLAYRHGIFPWYSVGEPILWWSPNPRAVLIPGELHVPRSLAKTLRNKAYEIRFDGAFAEVIKGCSIAARPGQAGTWIVDDIVDAYTQLHRRGWVHSIECWCDGKLAGGLYGVAIGRMFYGESMFAQVPDASKLAFVHLVRWLERQGFGLIDCQMRTEHLVRFGAREIERDEFLARMRPLLGQAPLPGTWQYRYPCDET